MKTRIVLQRNIQFNTEYGEYNHGKIDTRRRNREIIMNENRNFNSLFSFFVYLD